MPAIVEPIILETIKMTDSHPTADEIYERVRKRLPRISMGTIYRNLDVLASCGLIKRLDPGRTQMRFDGNTQEHYHGAWALFTMAGILSENGIGDTRHARSTFNRAKEMAEKMGMRPLLAHCHHELGKFLSAEMRLKRDVLKRFERPRFTGPWI